MIGDGGTTVAEKPRRARVYVAGKFRGKTREAVVTTSHANL